MTSQPIVTYSHPIRGTITEVEYFKLGDVNVQVEYGIYNKLYGKKNQYK